MSTAGSARRSKRCPTSKQCDSLLGRWIDEDSPAAGPSGRCAIERRSDGRIVGGVVLLPLPPRGEDLEIGWQLTPKMWGHGYATESTHGIAGWAFDEGLDELFAVVRPGNTRAAAVAHRDGMEWVGETEKYYGLTLQVYRLRPADVAGSLRQRANTPAPS